MTWATESDLRLRYGDEFVDKLGTRRRLDSGLNDYIADQSPSHISAVINAALQDAKDFLLFKLSCAYKVSASLIDGTQNFPLITQWHIRVTIDTLKAGGDCWSCACLEDLEKFLTCGTGICSDEGECLESLKTFVSVSPAKFPCECGGRCSCCK